MADDLPIIFQEQTKRIEALERLVAIRELLIPPDGKLVFDLKASDPPVEDGRVYYNSKLGIQVLIDLLGRSSRIYKPSWAE